MLFLTAVRIIGGSFQNAGSSRDENSGWILSHGHPLFLTAAPSPQADYSVRSTARLLSHSGSSCIGQLLHRAGCAEYIGPWPSRSLHTHEVLGAVFPVTIEATAEYQRCPASNQHQQIVDCSLAHRTLRLRLFDHHLEPRRTPYTACSTPLTRRCKPHR